jgi:hypothetical protein
MNFDTIIFVLIVVATFALVAWDMHNERKK